jgi:hypothetical protein
MKLLFSMLLMELKSHFSILFEFFHQIVFIPLKKNVLELENYKKLKDEYFINH